MDRRAGLLGGIEAGGTKIVCAVAADPSRPMEIERFPTREPEETMADVVGYFRRAREKHGDVGRIGIGTFGPAGVSPDQPGYGHILTTPKLAWKQFNFLGALRDGLGAETVFEFDTDVNAAALGEARFGAAKGKRHVAYITIGTGIGAGYLHAGEPVHGRMHPEAGHFVVPDLEGQFPAGPQPGFRGVCPFHDHCLEGRASGPAIEARWGKPGQDLAADHPAWEMEAAYLAFGMVNLTAAWSPEVIILGGGVSQQEGLLEKVRERFSALAGGYWDLPAMEAYVVGPELGQQAGIVGALSLVSG